jgi:proteasome lid subunit RPN8/RPN11
MAESEALKPLLQLRITRADYRLALDHLKYAYPHEGCGLMAGKDGRVLRIYNVDNRLASAYAYEMEPQQQLEAMLDLEEQGWDLLAIFHSHPSGPAAPSTVDLSTAYYPEAVYVIVSFVNPDRPVSKAFRLGAGRAEEIPLIVE